MRPRPIHAVAEDTEINVNDETEVQRWCRELGVTAQQLRNAVMNVGTKLADVEKELANQATGEADVTPAEDIPAANEPGISVASDGSRRPKP